MSILHDSRELSSENVMPQQPRTAFFTPGKNITAKSVFEALANAEIDAAEMFAALNERRGHRYL